MHFFGKTGHICIQMNASTPHTSYFDTFGSSLLKATIVLLRLVRTASFEISWSNDVVVRNRHQLRPFHNRSIRLYAF